MEFAEQFKAARERRGVTQRSLAARLDVSLFCIQSWESGRKLPSLPMLIKAAREMGESFYFESYGKRVVVGVVSDVADGTSLVKRRR